MGKEILAGLAFLLSIGCNQLVEPEPEVITETDTVYVFIDTTYVALPDYSFTLGITSQIYEPNESWGMVTFGEIFNDGDTSIVGLRPNLKLYRSVEEKEENNWFLNSHGYLGTNLIDNDLGVVLADSTDTLHVEEDLYHLLHSDSLSAEESYIYWRFKFDMNGTQQNSRTPQKSLEGRLKKAED